MCCFPLLCQEIGVILRAESLCLCLQQLGDLDLYPEGHEDSFGIQPQAHQCRLLKATPSPCQLLGFCSLQFSGGLPLLSPQTQIQPHPSIPHRRPAQARLGPQ